MNEDFYNEFYSSMDLEKSLWLEQSECEASEMYGV